MGGSKTEVRREGESKAEMFTRFGQDGQIPEEPEVPECVAHVWRWFFDLSSRRSAGMSGPAAITWGEISAWRDLCGIMTRPYEIDMLLSMDNAYRKALSSKDEQDTPQSPPKGMFNKV